MPQQIYLCCGMVTASVFCFIYLFHIIDVFEYIPVRLFVLYNSYEVNCILHTSPPHF